VSLAVYFVSRGRLVSQLDRLVKELDETDPGWRWDGILAAWPELKAEEDAAPRILAVVKALPRGWPDYKRMEPLSELAPNVALDPPRRKILEELLAAPPVPALRAQARDLVRFPRGRINPVLAEFPYASDITDGQKPRAAANLLALDALELAQAGKLGDAIGSSRACLMVSRTLEEYPFLVGQLARVAVAAAALDAAEKVMALGDAPDAELAALQEMLKHEAGRTGMLVAMRGERAGMHQTLTLLTAGKLDQTDGGVGPGAGGWWGLGWLSALTARELARREHPDILKLMTGVVDGARLPAKDQFAGEADFERRVTSASAGTVLRLLAPAVSKVGDAGRRGQSCAAALRGLIAVERYRLKHGRWPTKLDDCVPAFLDKVPDDPIDGMPVRYAKWADGVVVYSIGNDRTDDGGNVVKFQHDFGYRLWDPAKRRAAPPPLPPEAGPAGGPP
ncbi:MAG: hypothetical protein ACRC33_08425, partial [Gemmataceae bacterium]